MILQGLTYMVLGMTVVFAFLIILVLAVSTTSLLFKKDEVSGHEDEEGVAVALAAVTSLKNKR